MEDILSQQELPNIDQNQNHQIEEYDYLLIRLKDIKEKISLLENNLLLR